MVTERPIRLTVPTGQLSEIPADTDVKSTATVPGERFTDQLERLDIAPAGPTDIERALGIN